MEKKFKTSRGFPYPYGPTKIKDGTNFSVFSKHATAVSLCIFEGSDETPSSEIPLNPKKNRTGNVWHIFVSDLPDNCSYGYRVNGPYDPFKGLVFDNRSILIDPYSKLTAASSQWGIEPIQSHIHKADVFPFEPFDWEEVTKPNIPLNELVIYEMHVRGFTQDPSSNIKNRGFFLGIIEKIPYLKSLGVNAIELMPIFEFNECENVLTNPKTGQRLYNFWGYSTVNFFSPMRRYGTGNSSVISEFKTLVKELHKNGIEVILDVVYNHTSEGNQHGPTQSFKGFENAVYYMLGPNGEYYNFTGCGNTFNCNHPVVREFIRDSLRYWVTEMQVDGFRFDLASILVRGHDGIPLANPPLIEAITLDPILAGTKLIAEAWDAAGLYQVGSFPAMGVWAEWNGKYRDSIRRFIKGTDGEIGSFATRICGSEDLYGRGRLPSHSINFITAHDGFTLADLVSYNHKHNEENGEENRDGANDNESWNCGFEGLTNDPEILSLRLRQRKNFHATLMVSQGVPMILMGDEYGHTKLGNNNTWGHDSRLNWFQWDTLEQNSDFFRFYKMMIEFRKQHPILRRTRFLSQKEVAWHGVEPQMPDWNPKSRFLAFSLFDTLNHYNIYVGINAFYNPVIAHLPWSEKNWHRIVDTSLPSPNDILEENQAVEITSKTYKFQPYSLIILKTYETTSS